eukprot:GHVH01002443.1.p1 GENE.GHVH01002443.1~~GHVH01002443.1.p1  ORF type:complete len:2498 (+),score=316.29 GHVH01002443.1:2155-9648(+)
MNMRYDSLLDIILFLVVTNPSIVQLSQGVIDIILSRLISTIVTLRKSPPPCDSIVEKRLRRFLHLIQCPIQSHRLSRLATSIRAVIRVDFRVVYSYYIIPSKFFFYINSNCEDKTSNTRVMVDSPSLVLMHPSANNGAFGVRVSVNGIDVRICNINYGSCPPPENEIKPSEQPYEEQQDEKICEVESKTHWNINHLLLVLFMQAVAERIVVNIMNFRFKFVLDSPESDDELFHSTLTEDELYQQWLVSGLPLKEVFPDLANYRRLITIAMGRSITVRASTKGTGVEVSAVIGQNVCLEVAAEDNRTRISKTIFDIKFNDTEVACKMWGGCLLTKDHVDLFEIYQTIFSVNGSSLSSISMASSFGNLPYFYATLVHAMRCRYTEDGRIQKFIRLMNSGVNSSAVAKRSLTPIELFVNVPIHAEMAVDIAETRRYIVSATGAQVLVTPNGRGRGGEDDDRHVDDTIRCYARGVDINAMSFFLDLSIDSLTVSSKGYSNNGLNAEVARFNTINECIPTELIARLTEMKENFDQTLIANSCSDFMSQYLSFVEARGLDDDDSTCHDEPLEIGHIDTFHFQQHQGEYARILDPLRNRSYSQASIMMESGTVCWGSGRLMMLIDDIIMTLKIFKLAKNVVKGSYSIVNSRSLIPDDIQRSRQSPFEGLIRACLDPEQQDDEFDRSPSCPTFCWTHMSQIARPPSVCPAGDFKSSVCDLSDSTLGISLRNIDVKTTAFTDEDGSTSELRAHVDQLDVASGPLHPDSSLEGVVILVAEDGIKAVLMLDNEPVLTCSSRLSVVLPSHGLSQLIVIDGPSVEYSIRDDINHDTTKKLLQAIFNVHYAYVKDQMIKAQRSAYNLTQGLPYFEPNLLITLDNASLKYPITTVDGLETDLHLSIKKISVDRSPSWANLHRLSNLPTHTFELYDFPADHPPVTAHWMTYTGRHHPHSRWLGAWRENDRLNWIRGPTLFSKRNISNPQRLRMWYADLQIELVRTADGSSMASIHHPDVFEISLKYDQGSSPHDKTLGPFESSIRSHSIFVKIKSLVVRLPISICVSDVISILTQEYARPQYLVPYCISYIQITNSLMNTIKYHRKHQPEIWKVYSTVMNNASIELDEISVQFCRLESAARLTLTASQFTTILSTNPQYQRYDYTVAMSHCGAIVGKSSSKSERLDVLMKGGCRQFTLRNREGCNIESSIESLFMAVGFCVDPMRSLQRNNAQESSGLNVTMMSLTHQCDVQLDYIELAKGLYNLFSDTMKAVSDPFLKEVVVQIHPHPPLQVDFSLSKLALTIISFDSNVGKGSVIATVLAPSQIEEFGDQRVSLCLSKDTKSITMNGGSRVYLGSPWFIANVMQDSTTADCNRNNMVLYAYEFTKRRCMNEISFWLKNIENLGRSVEVPPMRCSVDGDVITIQPACTKTPLLVVLDYDTILSLYQSINAIISPYRYRHPSDDSLVKSGHSYSIHICTPKELAIKIHSSPVIIVIRHLEISARTNDSNVEFVIGSFEVLLEPPPLYGASNKPTGKKSNGHNTPPSGLHDDANFALYHSLTQRNDIQIADLFLPWTLRLDPTALASNLILQIERPKPVPYEWNATPLVIPSSTALPFLRCCGIYFQCNAVRKKMTVNVEEVQHFHNVMTEWALLKVYAYILQLQSFLEDDEEIEEQPLTPTDDAFSFEGDITIKYIGSVSQVLRYRPLMKNLLSRIGHATAAPNVDVEPKCEDSKSSMETKNCISDSLQDLELLCHSDDSQLFAYLQENPDTLQFTSSAGFTDATTESESAAAADSSSSCLSIDVQSSVDKDLERCERLTSFNTEVMSEERAYLETATTDVFPSSQGVYFMPRHHGREGIKSKALLADHTSLYSLLELQPKSDSVYPVPLPMGENIAAQLLDITDPRAAVFLSWATAPMLSWIILYSPCLCNVVDNPDPEYNRSKIISFTMTDVDHSSDSSGSVGKRLSELRKDLAPYLIYSPLEHDDTWRRALYTPLNLLHRRSRPEANCAFLSSVGAHCERTGVEFAVGISDIQSIMNQEFNHDSVKLQVQLKEISLWFSPTNLTGLRAPHRDVLKWPWFRGSNTSGGFLHRRNDQTTNMLKHLGRVSGDTTIEIQLPIHSKRPNQVKLMEQNNRFTDIHRVKVYVAIETIEIALTSSDFGNMTMITHHNLIDVHQRISCLYGEQVEAIIDNLRRWNDIPEDEASIGTNMCISLKCIEVTFLRARGDAFMTATAKGVYIENENVVNELGNQHLNVDLKDLSIVGSENESFILCPVFNNTIEIDEGITPSNKKLGGGSNMVHLRVAVHSFPLSYEYANLSKSRLATVIKSMLKNGFRGGESPTLSASNKVVSILDRFELTLHPVVLNAPRTLIHELSVFLGSCTKYPQSPASHSNGGAATFSFWERSEASIPSPSVSLAEGSRAPRVFPSCYPTELSNIYSKSGSADNKPVPRQSDDDLESALMTHAIDEDLNNHFIFLNYFRVNPLRIILTTDHTVNIQVRTKQSIRVCKI